MHAAGTCVYLYAIVFILYTKLEKSFEKKLRIIACDERLMTKRIFA